MSSDQRFRMQTWCRKNMPAFQALTATQQTRQTAMQQARAVTSKPEPDFDEVRDALRVVEATNPSLRLCATRIRNLRRVPDDMAGLALDELATAVDRVAASVVNVDSVETFDGIADMLDQVAAANDAATAAMDLFGERIDSFR